jgi:hypothetical protein
VIFYYGVSVHAFLLSFLRGCLFIVSKALYILCTEASVSNLSKRMYSSCFILLTVKLYMFILKLCIYLFWLIFLIVISKTSLPILRSQKFSPAFLFQKFYSFTSYIRVIDKLNKGIRKFNINFFGNCYNTICSKDHCFSNESPQKKSSGHIFLDSILYVSPEILEFM